MECRAVFDDQEVSVQIQRNDFNTERTMTDYKEVFFRKLSPLLKKLQGPNMVWADMGAGQGLAQLTFLKNRVAAKGFENLPTVRAYAFKYPLQEKHLQAIEKKYRGAFQYIEGKQSPETIRELDKVDLITDVVGIATYYKKAGSAFPADALEITKAYIDMLKPGGVLLIHPYMTGAELFPAEYLKQIDFEVVKILEGGESLMITKKNISH
jgi:predicted methyltransferase